MASGDKRPVIAQLDARVPSAEILGDSGVLSKLLDLSANVDTGVVQAARESFSVAETVYAIRYARIQFRYLSSRKLARMITRSTWKKDLDKALLET